MMGRTDILATTGETKLYGMKAACDEILAAAVKRAHEPSRVKACVRFSVHKTGGRPA